MNRPKACVDPYNEYHGCWARCYVEVISQGPPRRSLGEILRDPPKLRLETPHRKEETMTEAQYKAEISRLQAETRRLETERGALFNLAWEIREFCPCGSAKERKSHEWTILRADSYVVFGGGNVRSADFECTCGATMSISDGQAKVGG